ncbi:MAG: hypothetical protein HC812_18715, partial [Leptolyngbya sp. RL_3_1]|nr:hypothetical protein [Leptolyngbya sp. RL_3_1]
MASLGLRYLAGSAVVVGYCLLVAPPVFKWDRAYLPRTGSPRAEREAPPGLITPAPFDKPTVPESIKPDPAQPRNATPMETQPTDGDRKTDAPTKPEAGAPTQGSVGSATATPAAPPAPAAAAPRTARPQRPVPPAQPPSLADLTTPRPSRSSRRPLPEADIPSPATASTDFLRAFPPQAAVPTPFYQPLDEATLPAAPSSDFLATAPPRLDRPTSRAYLQSALADGGQLAEPTAPAFADPFATGPATSAPPAIAQPPNAPRHRHPRSPPAR